MFTISQPFFWGQSFFVKGRCPGRDQVAEETKGFFQVFNSFTFLHHTSVLGCLCWCICQGFEDLILCANRVSVCTKGRAAIGCVGGGGRKAGKEAAPPVWCSGALWLLWGAPLCQFCRYLLHGTCPGLYSQTFKL